MTIIEDNNENLKVASSELIKQELLQPEVLAPMQEQAITEQASNFVDSLFQMDLNQLPNQQLSTGKVENIGEEIQQQAAKQSELLKQPIATLSQRAEDGGEVANALIDLKMTVESLDPSKVDFDYGWFTRLIGHIPGVGTPIKRYLVKFENAQTVIASIVRSLEMGRDQLLRDNVTLSEDQKTLWETEKKLEKTLQYATAIDKKLEEKAALLKQQNDPQVKVIAEFLQFPIRQRLMDLQQQIVVQQQTLIASEIIIRNNKELARGVNRALNVTVSALQNATTIAMALANQQKVLQKVEKINETTSKLIESTAVKLKNQGASIHKGAASSQLDVQALKNALADINTALDDISNFRQQALPQMANVVNDLDHLIKEANEPLRQIQKKNNV